MAYKKRGRTYQKYELFFMSQNFEGTAHKNMKSSGLKDSTKNTKDLMFNIPSKFKFKINKTKTIKFMRFP